MAVSDQLAQVISYGNSTPGQTYLNTLTGATGVTLQTQLATILSLGFTSQGIAYLEGILNPAPLMPSFTQITNTESIGATIRRLHAGARENNPIQRQRLRGAKRWITATAYTIGQIVSTSVGTLVQAQGSGTSGATEPKYGGSDGTVTWAPVGLASAPVLTGPYSTHNAALTKVFNAPTGAAGTWQPTRTTPFHFTSGPPIADGNQNDMISFQVNQGSAGNIGAPGVGAGYYNYHTRVVIVADANIVEFGIYNCTQNYSVIVDGQYLDNQCLAGSAMWPGYLSIDFTNLPGSSGVIAANGRQRHVIELELSLGSSLLKVSCEPSGNIYYPDVYENWSWVHIGDSNGFGNMLTYYQDAFPVQMAKLLGIPTVVPCCIGGTGVVAAGSYWNYAAHAISDLALINAWRPVRMISVQCSQNDNTQTASAIQNGTYALFQQLRQAYPNALLVGIPCLTGASIVTANSQANEDAFITAINTLQAQGDTKLVTWQAATDPAGPWITGTGNSGTPNNDQSTFCYNTDGQHLLAAGHNLWARKNAAALMRAIQTVA